MDFQRFDGTTERERRSDAADGVKEVRVSEASRRDASGKLDRESLCEAQRELNEGIERKNARIAQPVAVLLRDAR